MKLTRESTVLVTGANGGIGVAIARAVHSTGARVIVSGRRRDALAPLEAELGARVLVADLANADDVRRLASEAGDIDVLVANAGLPGSGAVVDTPAEDIDRVLDVNLRAPMQLARAFAPGMVARGRGQIVFISSIAGKVAPAGSAIYSATKFGLRGFSLGLRADLASAGVGVTTIFPGFIRDAGMFAATGVKLPPGVGTRSPEDVADAVLRAIADDPAELDVAAIEQRVSAFLGSVTPGAIGPLQRLFGADRISGELAQAQRARR